MLRLATAAQEAAVDEYLHSSPKIPQTVTVLPSALPLLILWLLRFYPGGSIFKFPPIVKPRITL